MAVNVTIRSAANNPDGSLRLLYDYDEGGGVFTGNGITLQSVELDDRAVAQRACFGNSLGVLFIYLAWWKARSSDFSNAALVMNKTMVADLTAAAPIKVQ